MEIFKLYVNTKQFSNRGAIWEVSNLGNVKKNGKLFTPNIKGKGYLYFGHGYYVHRAVAELFIGKIPNGYEVDHIDRNKLNNNVNNLRIVSHLENMQNKNYIPNDIIKNKIKAALIGHKVSNEQKEKQSKTMKGRYSGKNNPMYGKSAIKGKHKVWNDDSHTSFHYE